MSLSKKMIIFIASLLIILLMGTFILNVNNSKTFLQHQLASHAQDTATSLGLSLSSIGDPEDTSSMETMINAVFDRGYYTQITLLDMDNQPIYQRKNPETIQDIPSLFIQLISISAPKAESLVQGGWMPIGKLVVQSHPGYAYMELWKTANTLSLWFILAALVAIGTAIYTLRVLLLPLKKMEKQAEAIVKKEYLLQDQIPTTIEFKQVVSAMNVMVHKMKDVFERDARNAEKLQKMAFQDKCTGLSNRLHFEIALAPLLDPLEESGPGAMCLMRINELKAINDQYGYLIGDKIMKDLADEMQAQFNFEHTLFARLNGTEIIAVMPGIQGENCAQKVEQICASLPVFFTQHNIEASPSNINLGIIDYQPGQTRGALMSQLEFALQQAEKLGPNKAFISQTSPSTQTDDTHNNQNNEWQTFLNEALKHNRFTLFEQAVYDYDKVPENKELYIRVKDAEGKIYPAGYFMPAVNQLNRTAEIDQLVIKLAFEYLESNHNADTLAINLTHSIINSTEMKDWLFKNLSSTNKNRLAFELPEKMIRQSRQKSEPLIQALKQQNITIGIDQFGGQLANMDYLQTLRPDYIKLDASFSNAIEQNDQTRLYIQGLSELCQSLDIRIIAMSVETEAQVNAFHELGINHFQGYYYGAPQPLSR